jgi:O-antigen/teichoic acid export membrane protein
MVGSLLDLTRRIRSSPLAGFAVGYAATAAFQKGVGFLLFVWAARTLGVEEYAVFGLLYALQSALTSFSSAGIVESAIGLLKTYPAPADRARLFSASNSAFVILAAGSSVFAVALGLGFLHDATAHAFANVAFVILAGLAAAYVSIQSSLVRLEEHHGASLSLGFVVPMAAFVGGAIGLYLDDSVTAFFAGSAIASLVALLPFVVLHVGHHTFQTDRGEVLRILSILGPFILIAMLAWLGGYGNIYLVQLFFEPAHVAAFAFVYSVSAIMQLVATSLNQVWSPRFYRLYQTLPQADVERRNRLFTVCQGVALGVIGGVALVAYTPAADFAGGNLLRYRGLRVELFFLFLAYAVSIPWWHAQNYFYAHGKGRELMRISISGAVAGLVLWLASATLFGPLGAYLGFFLQMVVRAAFALAWARREWRIRISWEGPLIAGCGMGLGLFVAHWLI